MELEAITTEQQPERVATDTLIGCVVDDRFTIEATLGEGGMGKVYTARQHSLDRQVALKVLHPRLAVSEKAIKRFEREARSASRLAHTNTVAIYDHGCSDDGRLYIAMELLQGTTLTEAITPGKSMDPDKIVDLLLQVCASVGDAHLAGVIHRDLKPDNIFLTRQHATRDCVKVLDFGFAKLLFEDDGEPLTVTGAIAGTPIYMSPEMIMGKEVDGRSDIYSLGVILYEMLCGDVPFDADSAVEILMAHVDSPPPPIQDRLSAGELYEPLAAVATIALAKDPADRYANMDELADALKAARPAADPGAHTDRRDVLAHNETQEVDVADAPVKAQRSERPTRDDLEPVAPAEQSADTAPTEDIDLDEYYEAWFIVDIDNGELRLPWWAALTAAWAGFFVGLLL